MTVGKYQKKMKRARQETVRQEQQGKWQEEVEQLEHLTSRNRLDEALVLAAQLIEAGCREPELMYQTAVVYFQQQDYERSAEWVDNTLQFAPGHLRAEVLLGRLCFLQDRVDDALRLFRQILRTGGQSLPTADVAAMQDMRAFYDEDGVMI